METDEEEFVKPSSFAGVRFRERRSFWARRSAVLAGLTALVAMAGAVASLFFGQRLTSNAENQAALRDNQRQLLNNLAAKTEALERESVQNQEAYLAFTHTLAAAQTNG